MPRPRSGRGRGLGKEFVHGDAVTRKDVLEAIRDHGRSVSRRDSGHLAQGLDPIAAVRQVKLEPGETAGRNRVLLDRQSESRRMTLPELPLPSPSKPVIGMNASTI